VIVYSIVSMRNLELAIVCTTNDTRENICYNSVSDHLGLLCGRNSNKTGGSGETTNPTAVCVFNRDSVHLVDKQTSS
jgi:hypothetical protein